MSSTPRNPALKLLLQMGKKNLQQFNIMLRIKMDNSCNLSIISVGPDCPGWSGSTLFTFALQLFFSHSTVQILHALKSVVSIATSYKHLVVYTFSQGDASNCTDFDSLLTNSLYQQYLWSLV